MVVDRSVGSSTEAFDVFPVVKGWLETSTIHGRIVDWSSIRENRGRACLTRMQRTRSSPQSKPLCRQQEARREITLYTTGLWFYSVMASLVFGASIYEALVVHPAWSRKPRSPLRIHGATMGRRWTCGGSGPQASLYALAPSFVFAVALWAESAGSPRSLVRVRPRLWRRRGLLATTDRAVP